MNAPEIFETLEPVIQVFEELGVHYYVGGSVASSAYGFARATLDVDLVSDLKQQHVPILVQKLKSLYYIDENAVLNAIRSNTSFNLIHLKTMFKVDVFILQHGHYPKLEWYKNGGCASERQWLDVLGVMKVQGNALDLEYLRQWAKELAVDGLLEKAIVESKI